MSMAFYLSLFASLNANPASISTSLEEKDCKVIESSAQDPNAVIDSFIEQCPGRDNIQVLHVGGDSRSWLVLKKGDATLDTYDKVTGDMTLGYFPQVSGKKITWRYANRKADDLKAVIFEISGTDDEAKVKTKLVVVRIEDDRMCVLGSVTTEQMALTLADSKRVCK